MFLKELKIIHVFVFEKKYYQYKIQKKILEMHKTPKHISHLLEELNLLT